MGRARSSADASTSRSSTSTDNRSTSAEARPATSCRSSSERSSPSRSSSTRMVASGLRSSCPASATKATARGVGATQPFEHAVERLRELRQLVAARWDLDDGRRSGPGDALDLVTHPLDRAQRLADRERRHGTEQGDQPDRADERELRRPAQRGGLDLGRHRDEHRVAAPVEAGRVGGGDGEALLVQPRQRVDGGDAQLARRRPRGRPSASPPRASVVMTTVPESSTIWETRLPMLISWVRDRSSIVCMSGRCAARRPPRPRCRALTPRAPDRARGR